MFILDVLEQYGATTSIARGSQKCVLATDDWQTVCKWCMVPRNSPEMNRIVRELLFRIYHPAICIVPKGVRMFHPPHSDQVMIVWKEERADDIGSEALSVQRFIDDTRETLQRRGFHDLHHRNVGRVSGMWKWFDV